MAKIPVQSHLQTGIQLWADRREPEATSWVGQRVWLRPVLTKAGSMRALGAGLGLWLQVLAPSGHGLCSGSHPCWASWAPTPWVSAGQSRLRGRSQRQLCKELLA